MLASHIPLAGFKTSPVTERTEKAGGSQGGRALKFIKRGLQKKKNLAGFTFLFFVFVFAIVRIREPRVT